MCGIVGYIGKREAAPLLLRGLRRLEYRGYDSAGLAVLDGGELSVCKAAGVLDNLEARIGRDWAGGIPGSAGIGHTRWATHGEPSDLNSHPHTDVSGSIAVVHNGIIENHARLRRLLGAEGVRFRSDTDTEAVAHLVDAYYDGDILAAVIDALKKIEGSYALGILCAAEPDRLIAVRKESPLVIGAGAGEHFIASDAPALLEHARDVYYLGDREIAVIYRDRVEFYTEDGLPLSKKTTRIEWDAAAAEKAGYEHFMLKEIHEQPKAMTDTLRPRLADAARGGAGRLINLDEIGFDESWAKARRVVISACGTAWHAGVIAKYAFEHFARVPVDVDMASEFRYRDPVYDAGDIFIIISQSGETADTLAAARMAKKRGARIIAITNVVGSTLAREAGLVMYTWAGPEIAVASTKAFTAQLMCLYLIALRLGFLRGALSPDALAAAIGALEKIPAQAEQILARKETIQRFAAAQRAKNKVFYMGRLFDYAAGLESALKLKEISYAHSEAFAAGELKHGPIALVDRSTLVAALCTQTAVFDKMESNIKEVKARGASVAVITWEDTAFFDDAADAVFRIPRAPDSLSPLLSVIPAQLFAYYCAVLRGNNPDKPRNLAKSVTVE